MKQNISELSNAINNHISNKKKFFLITYTKTNISFLQFLYLEGYILFFFKKDNEIYVKLKFNQGQCILKKLQSISIKGQRKTISYKSNWYFSSFKENQIISTDKGFLSSKISKKIKKGGFLVLNAFI